MKKKILIIITIILVIIIATIIILYSKPRVSVLTYHNVGTVKDIENTPSEETWTITTDAFEEQISYLAKNNYKSLTMEEFYKWKKGEISVPFKSVLITFDDGKLSNYQYAFPILKKYNMNATVFLAGAYIENGKSEWNGSLTDYISKELILKCKNEYPNIEFHSHSYNLHDHGLVEKRKKEELSDDLKTFKKQIKDTKFYAYPFGDKNKKMEEALRENDYELAFLFGPTKKEYRKATREDKNYEIPRLNFSYNTSLWKFKLRLLLPF